jgi:prepilin-type N-terminal cleavage/methylation domain-containing protein
MKKGFALVEILLAVAIFSIIAGVFISLMIDAYKINQRARDLNLATVLAEEGVEAVRSIRDINFKDLNVNKNYSQCLAIENNRWLLIENNRRDCVEKINNFSRQVFIIGSGNQRNIAVVVSWQPISGTQKQIKLFVRLNNWRR